MAESLEALQRRLEEAVAPGYRERLLDRGLARGLIWRDGVLPPDSPPFAESLTEDLLDYAHTVLEMALRLRSLDAGNPALGRAFLVAGEAIEAAVHKGSSDRDDASFNRVSAAVAFHLARYSARSYSLLPTGSADQNLAPTEVALVGLLRRSLDVMQGHAAAWLLAEGHQDAAVAARLERDELYDEGDAISDVLTTSFMRGIALFDHAILTGDSTSADRAKERFRLTALASRDTNFVSHWWTATLASHLVDELWELSLHHQIPSLPPDEDTSTTWSDLRRGYVQRLRARSRAAIELWPSQLQAAQRAADEEDDLVVALPTSAGKTRIAELCILRALAAGRRVVYVTPLRALSAQVERDLGEVFAPLGFSVSALYGAAGIEAGDTHTIRAGDIVVSTPEKLDFALRNDSTVIDDVGLVVLDEGHMLGPSEREIRYEAFVQRLLRRSDAGERRVVCLSALFPTPDEMKDLVAWIRQDYPGAPVHSTWRPTRQRFGVLRWVPATGGNPLSTGSARLDIAMEGESPYVRRFVEASTPPEGSRRRRLFPANKNELTLASAWRFVEQGKAVLVYCALRASVETLGRLVLKCIEHGVLPSLGSGSQMVKDAMAAGAEWLGEDHPAVACLAHGVALHHGGLPRPFLNQVERLLRSGDCPITIASPTLAQGLNLSASVLLVPSIWRNQEVIPPAEFANVAGRAGRAFVDVEGLVLHVLWEEEPGRASWALRKWSELVSKAKAPVVRSGILQLAASVFARIARAAKIPLDEVVDYVTGNGAAWDFPAASEGVAEITEAAWERDLASLDAAMLALLDAEADDGAIDAELDSVLAGSLFARQLSAHEPRIQNMVRGFLSARARLIWSRTTAPRRRGYHVAGIGLRAGEFLDAHISDLVKILRSAEEAVASSDGAAAAEAAIQFAEMAFQTAPFRPPDALPASWRQALRGWVQGLSAAKVVSVGGEDGVDLLQEALAYRLPWAMEAVRVHANAVECENADALTGIAAMAVEAGACDLSAITLLRSGLSSREAALTAVGLTSASFDDHAGMMEWLSSDTVQELSGNEGFPTAQSRGAWLQFVEAERRGRYRKWARSTQVLPTEWLEAAPAVGTRVVIRKRDGGSGSLVLSPELMVLGSTNVKLERAHQYVVDAVAAEHGGVSVEYFGPRVP